MTDVLLYTTIWLAVVAWAATEVLRRVGRGRPAARLVWTAGAALLAVHTAIAFHSRHAADRALFAFFLFMMVNGAVVFAMSRMRWLGVVCVAAALAARVWPILRLAVQRN